MFLGVERFDSKVIPEPNCGCYLWTASTNKSGYGKYSNGKSQWVLAHRYAYEHVNGEIPKNMLVCHKCDTPSCVNPEHLFVGTHKDNAADRDKKSRRVATKGSARSWSKLDEDKVRDIRNLYFRGGVSTWALGKHYGVSSKTVYDIVNGNRWKHVA